MSKNYFKLAFLLLFLTIGFGLIFVLINFNLNIGQFLALVGIVAFIPLSINKPVWGLFAFLALRNIIDIFDQYSFLQIGPFSLKLAALLGLILIPWAIIVILRILHKQKAEGISVLLKIPLVKTWLCLIFVAIFSTIFANGFLSDSVEVIIKFINYALLFVVGFLLAKDIGLKSYLKWIFLMLLVPSFVAIAQFFTGSGYSITGVGTRLMGTYAHPNAFGFALVIGLACLILLVAMSRYRKERLIWLALSLFIFILLLFTFTRSAWVALFIIVVIWLIFYQRKLILPFLVSLILLVSFFPLLSDFIYVNYDINLNNSSIVQRLQPEPEEESGSLSWRLRTWGETLPAVWESPIIGHGPGSFPRVRENYISYYSDLASLEAHNDYLRIAVEIGLVGLFVFIFLYFNLLITIVKHKKESNKLVVVGISALIIALMIASFADNVLRNAPVQWMYWTLMGVAVGYLNEKDELPDNKIK